MNVMNLELSHQLNEFRTKTESDLINNHNFTPNRETIIQKRFQKQ